MDPIWILSFLLLGGFVGFIAGLLGVGGGAVMVPILTVIFMHMGIDINYVVHLALGTAMMSIVATSFASAWAHQKHHAINWHIVKWLSPGIILGTFSGTFLVAFLNTFFLSLFFSAFVFFVAVKLLRKPKTKHVQDDANSKSCEEHSLPKNSFISCAGIVIGAVSAMVSIGGGSLTVPYLMHFNLPMNKAIATSAATGFIISVAGSLGYLVAGATMTSGDALQLEHMPYTFGAIYFPAVLFISIVSIFTARFGANLAHNMPIAALKKIFAILLILLSAHMLYNVFFA